MAARLCPSWRAPVSCGAQGMGIQATVPADSYLIIRQQTGHVCKSRRAFAMRYERCEHSGFRPCFILTHVERAKRWDARIVDS